MLTLRRLTLLKFSLLARPARATSDRPELLFTAIKRRGEKQVRKTLYFLEVQEKKYKPVTSHQSLCDYRKRGVRYKDEGNYQFKNTTISEDNNRKLTPVNHLMLDVGQSESQNNLGHKY